MPEQDQPENPPDPKRSGNVDERGEFTGSWSEPGPDDCLIWPIKSCSRKENANDGN